MRNTITAQRFGDFILYNHRIYALLLLLVALTVRLAVISRSQCYLHIYLHKSGWNLISIG